MLVVALNGFLGNRDKDLDVTDIVDKTLDMVPDRKTVTVIEGHGGAGPIKFNKLYKRIESRASKETVLCLVGKSYGGHWCVNLLWRLAERGKLDEFKAVGMVTVDPAFALYKLQRKVFQIPLIDKAVNVHQYGFRSGYRLGPPASNIAVEAGHTDIETVDKVQKEILDLLLWGHVKQADSMVR